MTDETKAGPDGARELTPGERTVGIAEIPLPPEAMRGDWDEAPSGKASAEPKADAPARAVAELDYVGGSPALSFRLDHPFRLDGRTIEEIVMVPLTVEETGRIVRQTPPPDVVDFYAAMAGLPADVVRALRGRDGERVTETGFGFLPRFMGGRGGA